MELLHILKHPRYPDYRELREWVGTDFGPALDPTRFRRGPINRELKRRELKRRAQEA